MLQQVWTSLQLPIFYHREHRLQRVTKTNPFFVEYFFFPKLEASGYYTGMISSKISSKTISFAHARL